MSNTSHPHKQNPDLMEEMGATPIPQPATLFFHQIRRTFDEMFSVNPLVHFLPFVSFSTI